MIKLLSLILLTALALAGCVTTGSSTAGTSVGRAKANEAYVKTQCEQRGRLAETLVRYVYDGTIAVDEVSNVYGADLGGDVEYIVDNNLNPYKAAYNRCIDETRRAQEQEHALALTKNDYEDCMLFADTAKAFAMQRDEGISQNELQKLAIQYSKEVSGEESLGWLMGLVSFVYKFKNVPPSKIYQSTYDSCIQKK